MGCRTVGEIRESSISSHPANLCSPIFARQAHPIDQFPSADIDNRMFALTQNEGHGNANYNKLIEVGKAFAVEL